MNFNRMSKANADAHVKGLQVEGRSRGRGGVITVYRKGRSFIFVVDSKEKTVRVSAAQAMKAGDVAPTLMKLTPQYI